MVAKQKLKAAKTTAPSSPDVPKKIVSSKQKGKKDVKGKGSISKGGRNTQKKAQNAKKQEKKVLQKLISGAIGNTVQCVTSKKLNLQRDQKSIKTIQENRSTLKEEPKRKKETCPQKGKKRKPENSVAEKSSGNDDNSPELLNEHNSKSIKKVLEKESILKEEQNLGKEPCPKKGEKRKQENSGAEKFSEDDESEEPPVKRFRRNDDNSPELKDVHSSKSSDNRAVSTECMESQETISQKQVLDLRNILMRTVQPAPLPGDGCGCRGMGDHSVSKTKSELAVKSQPNDDVAPHSCISTPALVRADDNSQGHPDCTKSVLGEYHQGNIPMAWNPSDYQGTQCTTTAYASIVASRILPVGLWSSNTINNIVRLGDQLHGSLLDQRFGPFQLASDEMPELPEDKKFIWPVYTIRGQEIQGLIYPNPQDPKLIKSQLKGDLNPGLCCELGDALERSLVGEIQGSILTLNGRSSAIFKSPVGGYVVFDSHARNILGVNDDDGKASLLRFPSLSQLVAYFRGMTVCETMYSLTGFKVEPTAFGA